ncbi:methyltransferase [Sphaerisporangium melleum]|uniref:Methyltransferase n=2 Tax=Sphaerisporangium melleum TaxID=321316 RepID=A0A917QU92_9ACTN|nr:methyltransferase [Sphaerisporangium melleum]GII68852.1 methyltransferase [Sphaerisporangium melleum]
MSFLADTRAGYNAIAGDYVEMVKGELAPPVDRGLLTAFAEIVRAGGGAVADRADGRSAGRGPVVEVGCGPGRITAHLHGLGVDIFGIDLSPRMVAIARETYPGLWFEEGSMTALDLPDGGLAGLVSWYSLIHIPPEHRPGVLAEFHRVLAPGGHLLLAFQVGDEPVSYTEAFGHQVSLVFHRLSPDGIAGLLRRAGFTVSVQMLREQGEREKTPQACLLARKPA